MAQRQKSIRANVAPNQCEGFFPALLNETQGVRDVTVFVLGRHQPVIEACQPFWHMKGYGDANNPFATHVALSRIFQDQACGDEGAPAHSKLTALALTLVGVIRLHPWH